MAPSASRPLIGVTTYRQLSSWWAWERDAALVPGLYLDMVEAAGGRPLLIPPGRGHTDEPYERMVDAIDGLVLIGGGDIDAARYGQTADERNGGTNDRRDDLEIGLLAASLASDLPVLAVCRGLQLLNVVLGGDLVQHLPDRIGSIRHQPRPGSFGQVTVATETGSVTSRLLGDRLDVLCCHHQAIDTLGRGLVVSATSDDGIVEAVEMPERRFVVGVQWHPEEMGDARLVEALVEAVPARPHSKPAASARA